MTLEVKEFIKTGFILTKFIHICSVLPFSDIVIQCDHIQSVVSDNHANRGCFRAKIVNENVHKKVIRQKFNKLVLFKNQRNVLFLVFILFM